MKKQKLLKTDCEDEIGLLQLKYDKTINSNLYQFVISLKKRKKLYNFLNRSINLFYNNRKINTSVLDVTDILGKIQDNKNTLVISPLVHGNNWMGINNSTKVFFSDSINIIENFDDDMTKLLAKEILLKKKNMETIIFSGITLSYLSLMKTIKNYDHTIKIKIMYHGSLTQLSNYHDKEIFKSIVLHSKYIDAVGCFKSDIVDYFKSINIDAYELQNKVATHHIDNTKKFDPNATIHFGLMSNNGWIKNIYNQFIAIANYKNGVVHVQDKSNFDFPHQIKVVEHGVFDHEDFLEFIKFIDIYLHVSFSECSPMTPLEVMAEGIPCVMQSGVGFFEKDSLLYNALCVVNLDDSREIKEKVETIINDYPRISKACKEFVTERNKLATTKMKAFLDA